MKEKYIQEMIEIAMKVDENELLYILTYIQKWFGSL